ncbi:hypothetical protein QZH41_005489, partial [Actinostola sp. cb2023]
RNPTFFTDIKHLNSDMLLKMAFLVFALPQTSNGSKTPYNGPTSTQRPPLHNGTYLHCLHNGHLYTQRRHLYTNGHLYTTAPLYTTPRTSTALQQRPPSTHNGHPLHNGHLYTTPRTLTALHNGTSTQRPPLHNATYLHCSYTTAPLHNGRTKCSPVKAVGNGNIITSVLSNKPTNLKKFQVTHQLTGLSDVLASTFAVVPKMLSVSGLWNGIWSDMFIETTFMHYGHGPGGIIGITLKPETLKTWALGLHICCRLKQAIAEILGGINVQDTHKEETKAKIASNGKLKIRLYPYAQRHKM